MRQIRLIYILVFFFSFINTSIAEDNVFIEVKVDNEAITNIDILNEKNYLIALNNNLNQLSKKKIHILAKKSIINETIKKKELLKFFDFEKTESFVEQLIQDFYVRLNLRNKNEFKKYLLNFELEIEYVKEKLMIEALWNQFIFEKFSSQVIIDEQELKKKLKKEISQNKSNSEEYFLYEILFELNTSETLKRKYQIILESIKNSGFKNTSNLYGISDLAKYGGEIGWIKKTQLSKKIIDELDKIKISEITKPIQINNGFLILKLESKRKIEKKINFDEELNKLISSEKNRQLNQLSLIYFNKIKQRILISES